MITITKILHNWLTGAQHYEQGIDILQRLSNDARLIAFFRKFQSDYTKRRLFQEVSKLYDLHEAAPAASEAEKKSTESGLAMVEDWVHGEQGYHDGINIFEALGADAGLVAFFSDRFTPFSGSLLQKEMIRLLDELTRLRKEEIQRTAPKPTIRDVLSYWLNNSDHDYVQGVNLISVLSTDKDLVSFFQKYNSDFAHRRLVEELEKIYEGMMATVPLTPTVVEEEQAPPRLPKNPELEVAAAHKASQLYKQMMNDRAVLFNLTKVEGWDDPNKPDLVEQRRQLALSICAQNYEVGEAYDELAHVRQHGTLPNTEEEKQEEGEVPDLELKPTIDNLRKALSKLRQKEQTPERVAKIQQHESRLQELLQRWNRLKQPEQSES